ncbi:MAG: hypothetical protein AAFO15_00330 [Pseudomonadota bacterium]
MMFRIIFNLLMIIQLCNFSYSMPPMMYSSISQSVLLNDLLDNNIDKVFNPLYSEQELYLINEYQFMFILHKAVFENY